MRRTFHILAAGAAVAFTAAVAASPASATCTRLAFSVNDYGKDGPAKDAKGLLDKYVSKWAVEHGIKKYTTGTKDVSCEMFLNFILFDEHTCKASASVCWDGPAVAGMPNVKEPTSADAKAPTAKTTTGSIDKSDAKPDVKKDAGSGQASGSADAKAEKKVEKKAPASTSAGSTSSSASTDAVKPARTAAKAKAKALSSGDAAKAAEVKPKAPLAEKPESAPVQ